VDAGAAAEETAPESTGLPADGAGAVGTAAPIPDAAAAASGDALPSAGKEPPLGGPAGVLFRSLFLAGFAPTLLNVPAKSAVPPLFLVESAD
jgi:hypothetical protein